MNRGLWGDIAASLVVFLVAIPLSIGIALASGLPPEKAPIVGLLAAVIGGIVVGALGGSPLQISGPAAGLAVLVAVMVQDLGLPGMWMATFLAGVVQVIAGIARLGRLFRAISPALIEGMLSGIGLLIFSAQIHIIAGITPPGTGQEFGGLLNFLNIPRTIYAIATQSHHALPALLGIFTIGMLIGWEKVKPPSLRLLPSPLMAIGLATGVTVVLSLPVTRIQVPSNPLEGIVSPLSHSWELLGEREVWLSALTLAFVASTESLLSATAVDSLQNHAPRTQYNRVLWGEGAGNILCGLLGLLPVSGVIVRSSANILAGARTRLASILHGVWLLIGIWAFPSLLNHIPLPALAALLAYTGLRLINYKEFLMLWRVDRAEAILFLLTMGTIVATDLFVGIVVGVIGALLSTLNRLSALEIQRTEAQPGHIKLEISGAATFLRLPQLAETLEQLPARSFIHIHTDGLQYLDYTCADYLYKWYQQYTQQGGKVVGISRFRIRRWHRRHRKK